VAGGVIGLADGASQGPMVTIPVYLAGTGLELARREVSGPEAVLDAVSAVIDGPTVAPLASAWEWSEQLGALGDRLTGKR